MSNSILSNIGHGLAKYLNKTILNYTPFSVHDTSVLKDTLQPGDILLVEGNARVSSIIKYLTQSTWSHAAFYAGHVPGQIKNGESCCLIEAELGQGIIAAPLSKYKHFNTRICRPINVTDEDKAKLVEYMTSRIGYKYDLKNIIDLMRYLFPAPIPSAWRRKALALGSGEPSKAICSSLIAQAFQSINYPILPKKSPENGVHNSTTDKEILITRHHSLFTPRDFDISPYFQIIKPTIESQFNYKNFQMIVENIDEQNQT